MSVPVSEAELDRGVSFPTASRPRVPAVLVVSKSEDANLWRSVEGHRSRLEEQETTLLLLSEGAAESMQRFAPNLVSYIGTIWAVDVQASVGESLSDVRLARALHTASAGRYPALYEIGSPAEALDLESVVHDVLSAVGDPRVDERAWRSFGFMARAVLTEVRPTLAAHWPPGLVLADGVLAALDIWLASNADPPTVRASPSGPRAPQALGEALGVVESARVVLDRSQAHAALLDILDSVFQGYAILPGSEGRRAIFDWWLKEVVPAAFALRVPRRLALSESSAS